MNVTCSVFFGENDNVKSSYLLPLGIVYCATALEQCVENHVTTYLFNLREYYQKQESFFQKIDKHIIETKCEIFCISGLSVDFIRITKIVKHMKEKHPTIIVVLGGGMVTAEPEYVLCSTGADFGIIGEGELVLPELIERIKHHDFIPTDLYGIVCYREDGSVCVNPNRDIQNIDNIPFPDFSLFPTFEDIIRSSGVYPIVMSRSCPFCCSFCFHTSGSHYRIRSYENMVGEILNAKKKYGIKHLFFLDELFGVNIDSLEIFLSEIKCLELTFSAQTRADLISENLVQLLKSNNCTNLSIGIESVSNEVLHSMNKKLTFEQIENALDIITKNGLETSGNIIIGDPAETEKTAEKSIRWYEINREKYHLSIGMVQCYPGSKIFHYAVEKNIIDRNCFLATAEQIDDFALNLTAMPQAVYQRIKKKVYTLKFLNNFDNFDFQKGKKDS